MSVCGRGQVFLYHARLCAIEAMGKTGTEVNKGDIFPPQADLNALACF